MTHSKIEAIVTGLKTWLAANFPTYVTRANAGTTGTQAPAIKKYSVSDTMAPSDFPLMIVNCGSVNVEPSGPQSQMIHVSAMVDIGIQAPKPEARETILVRYMDALVDCIGENETLGGLVLSATIEELDKDAIPNDGRGFVISTIRMTVEALTQ